MRDPKVEDRIEKLVKLWSRKDVEQFAIGQEKAAMRLAHMVGAANRRISELEAQLKAAEYANACGVKVDPRMVEAFKEGM